MTGALVSAASVSRQPIVTTIDAGSDSFGTTSQHVFAKNNAHVAGGSGTYTYAWAILGDGLGAWSFTGQGTSAVTPIVNNVGVGRTSFATLTCTATDTRTHQSDTSPGVSYSYNDIGTIHI